MAVAAIANIAAQLTRYQQQHLTCAALWQACPPPHIHSGVWQVVCLAAVDAMDSGRRLLYRHSCEATVSPIPSTSRFVIARFWDILQDFCSSATPPTSWAQAVSANHPFFAPGPQGWHLTRR